MRLHLELYSEYSDPQRDEKIRRYGGVRHGSSISRDIVVPRDLPLYALHYVIQRAFGWQNSHLHEFTLPHERRKRLTGDRLEDWARMVGRVFRSPLMDENAPFWADDYKGGSFKFWLRRKYTGPYHSGNWGEEYSQCRRDMKRLDMNALQYVMLVALPEHMREEFDGPEFVRRVVPVIDYQGNENPPPEPYRDEKDCRIETLRLGDVPVSGLWQVFEVEPFALLERLPVSCVLAAGRSALPEHCPETERQEIEEMIDASCRNLLSERPSWSSPVKRDIERRRLSLVYGISPVTDELLYHYDFADSWRVRITASDDCPDLLKSGRVTQKELDQANVKCREKHRPVLLTRDGEMLVDDLGGMSGFAEFLEVVCQDVEALPREEQDAAKAERKRLLVWAKSLGWHRDEATNYYLL